MKLPGHNKISKYCATAWTKNDGKLLHARIGDCASQAVFEAYMLMLAINTWLSDIKLHSGKLRLIGDAKGVLQAVLARKAKSPQA